MGHTKRARMSDMYPQPTHRQHVSPSTEQHDEAAVDIDEYDEHDPPDSPSADISSLLSNPVAMFLRTMSPSDVIVHVRTQGAQIRTLVFILPTCVQHKSGVFTGEASKNARLHVFVQLATKNNPARLNCPCDIFQFSKRAEDMEACCPHVRVVQDIVQELQAGGDRTQKIYEAYPNLKR